jgi:hypothetical protein
VRGRLLRILIAGFWFVWTGIIIPGHTRGAITVDGKQTIGSCCQSKGADGKPQPVRSSSNCAVCHLAAKLMPASAFSIRLDPGELLEILPLGSTAAPVVVAPALILQSRAPPAAS